MAIKNFILWVHLNNHISSKVNYGKDYLRFLIEERISKEINDYNNNIFYTYSGPIIVVKYSCRNGNTVVWYAAVVEDLAKHISWAKTGSCSKFCTLRRKLFLLYLDECSDDQGQFF
jgi:hypothetical protein